MPPAKLPKAADLREEVMLPGDSVTEGPALAAEAHWLDGGNSDGERSHADSLPSADLSDIRSLMSGYFTDDDAQQAEGDVKSAAPEKDDPMSSSAVPEPVPSAAPSMGEVRAPCREAHATTLVVFREYGDIRYNAEAGHIVAICNNPNHGAHGDCRKIRTVKGPVGRTALFNPHQGRPLGLLSAWLKVGSVYETAEDHKSGRVLTGLTREQRARARSEFMQESDSALISQFERACVGDEPEEPDFIR